MPPRREPCRNFQRGSCQYGDRCKFLHVNPQQAKPNPFGFGTQNGTQYQRPDSQPQKPNPFGFGVQNNSQTGSKTNQFKPGENKWSRFSPINTGTSSAPQKSDNQPSAPNHTCTDSESCKRQIIEDSQNEKPLWKLTCYGHCKNGPCDIVGDISCEELRAAAYEDAKQGKSIQSIVERERSLLNSKLVEFESLLHNPYTIRPNSNLATQSPFPASSSNVFPQMTQINAPPSVSSFSQLGSSFNTGFQMRPAAPANAFGQLNQFQTPTQISNTSEKKNFTFGVAGPTGSQPPGQSFGSSFPTSTTTFGVNAERNPFSNTASSPSLDSTNNRSSVLFSGQNSSANGVAASTTAFQLTDNAPKPNVNGDIDSIWFKDEWKPGEIPEEAPPEAAIY